MDFGVNRMFYEAIEYRDNSLRPDWDGSPNKAIEVVCTDAPDLSYFAPGPNTPSTAQGSHQHTYLQVCASAAVRAGKLDFTHHLWFAS
jgi:hypothetical protein